MNVLKTIIIGLFCLWTLQSSAQVVSKQSFSTIQLLEDFDFYIQKLHEVHPALYTFTTESEFQKEIASIREKINKPMDASTFRLIVAETNSLMDGHSGISLGLWDSEAQDELLDYIKGGGRLLPLMKIEGNEVYYGEKKVIYINGKSMDQIMEKFNRFFTPFESKQRCDIIKRSTLFMQGGSFIFFQLNSPYQIETKSPTGERHNTTEQGWTLEDYQNYKMTHNKPWVPIDYELYPTDSIACINFNTCAETDFSTTDLEHYKKEIDSVFVSVSSPPTKYLFINVTKNEGGSSCVGNYVINKIAHDPFYYTFSCKTKISKVYCDLLDLDADYYRALTGQITGGERENQMPLTKGFSGKVFILQGPLTYSAADEFCRIAKASGRCTLVGRSTGQKNKTLIMGLPMRMPHTGIKFTVSCNDVTYYDCENDGLCADIPYLFDGYQTAFTKAELLEILRLYKETTNN